MRTPCWPPRRASDAGAVREERARLKAFVAAVFGGIGSIPGAVLGAYIIGVCESLIKANDTIAIFSNAFTFALLILVLLFKPNGMFGEKLTEKV